MFAFPDIFRSTAVFFAGDPSVLLLQILLLGVAALVVFLVLFAARDILMRSDSFWIQILSILLVAVLPILGFFLYLLIRPATTLSERSLRRDVEQVLRRLADTQAPRKPQQHEKSRKQHPVQHKVIASSPSSHA